MFDLFKEVFFVAALAASDLTDRIVRKTGSTVYTDIAKVVLREGMDRDGSIILTSDDITAVRVAAMRQPARDYDWAVVFELNERGSLAFAEATGRIALKKGLFSVWVNARRLYSPSVSQKITSGRCVVSGIFRTYEDAQAIVNEICEDDAGK